ncbi:MAG: hypothetical protein KKD33_02215, partial [Verrucomicrobia bacterium]|nr:hypothetical protein [Verrucomicrobiota bacterium]
SGARNNLNDVFTRLQRCSTAGRLTKYDSNADVRAKFRYQVNLLQHEDVAVPDEAGIAGPELIAIRCRQKLWRRFSFPDSNYGNGLLHTRSRKIVTEFASLFSHPGLSETLCQRLIPESGKKSNKLKERYECDNRWR